MPKKLDDCVAALVADGTPEDQAWAICTKLDEEGKLAVSDEPETEDEGAVDKLTVCYRTFPFEIETRGLADGQFSGYAAVFDEYIEAYNEIVDKGAFKQTLRHTKGIVPVLYLHDPYEGWVGMGLEGREDDRGLAVRAQLLTAHSDKAREVYGLIKLTEELKRPAGLSIGFRTIKDNFIGADATKAKVRHLKEVALMEYSAAPPGFQAGPSAQIGATRMQRDAVKQAVVECLLEMGIKTPALEALRSGTQGAGENVEALMHSVNETLDRTLAKLRR